jgi:hypothetical protein
MKFKIRKSLDAKDNVLLITFLESVIYFTGFLIGLYSYFISSCELTCIFVLYLYTYKINYSYRKSNSQILIKIKFILIFYIQALL